MSKKFLIVISFVLVFALTGLVQALEAVDINNPSFELAPDGNRVPGHSGYDGIAGWQDNYGGAIGWVGVDVMCPYANSTHCHRWPGPTDPEGTGSDVVYSYIQNTGANAYQVLTPANSDGNAVIAAGRKYILTVDAMGWNEDELTMELFYVPDVNFPDSGHAPIASRTRSHVYIERPLEDCQGESILDDLDTCPDWSYDEKLQFVAVAGQACLGKTLGVKFTAELEGGYTFIDNVRLDWGWATTAYDPNPEDEAVNVSRTKVLNWKPGTLVASADGHQVYLGTDRTVVENADTTDTTGIYRGAMDTNSYDPPETFPLAAVYYWRVDEVNSAYSGTQPPAGPWTGDVWSFTVTGYATNPNPANGAENVSPEVILSWTAATDATAHAVYLGTNAVAVSNADSTDTTGIYRGTQATPDVDYDPEFLTFGKTYYWRIDAVSAVTIKGYVWSFTVAPFNPVDDYELYANHTALKAAWNDYWYGPGHTNHGYAFVNTDANFTRDGNSMMFTYNNSKSHGGSGYVGSWTTGLVSKIPVGNDWTAGGVEGLVLYFYGKAGNWITQYDQMYVRLADGATPSHAGVVRLPDMNDVAEASWHEWNIDLADPAFSTVVKTNVTSIRIGFGGPDGGGGNKAGGTGTMYFDDIQLWPPRCRPELPNATDFDDDCTTSTGDLAVMANTWLFTDGYTKIATKRPGTLYGNPTWVTAGYTGNALQFDGVDDFVNVPDPCLTGAAAMSITCWVKPTAANDWTAMVCSRESVGCGDDGSEIGLYGKAYGGPDGLGYDWSCGTEEWQYDAGLADPVTGQWTFCALAVDTTGASLYMRQSGGALQIGTRNAVAHSVQKNFAKKFWIGMSKQNEGYFIGVIDDVRIYDYALTQTQVTNMSAAVPSDPNPWPVYWYKFEEGSGTTAADSGYGANIYRAVDSPANLTDPEAQGSRKVNFMDFAIIADNWLEQIYWP